MVNTVQRLKKGEVVEVDGIKLRMAQGDLVKGDLYVGERNTGPHLLEVAKVVMHSNPCEDYVNYVVPLGTGYPYDGNEVVKVEEAV